VAESRLVELADGRIGYALKKRWRDGTTAVVMTKAVLMERLCALVPKPRKHLVTYHGVLAPASGLRPKVCRGSWRRKAKPAAVGTELLGESRGVGVGRGRRGPPWPRWSRTSPPPRLRPEAAGGAAGAGAAAGSAWWRQATWWSAAVLVGGVAAAGVRDRGLGLPEVLGSPPGAGGDPRSGVDRAGAGAMGLSAAVPEQAGCRAPPAGEGVADIGEGTAE
jgi:hypothetical protein